MSLIHPALIYAAGLAAIPVILHFLLRAKPKKLPFPALRLILLRRRQNVRRMRLRHVWLMLLRMLVIIGLAIAAARPSLPEANYEFNTRELVTLFVIVAAAFGTYIGLMRTWRKRKVSPQTLAYRRTVLRGGLGTAVAVLVALTVILPYVNRLRAEISAPAPIPSSDLPVAAVFVFDTSLSMQYTQEGKTRLDQAKAIALEHIDTLPPRSRIAVGDTSSTLPILFQADLVGAKSKIQGLVPHPVSQPLNDRLQAALLIQEQDQGRTLDEQLSVPRDARRDRYIREVYLFTDLAATAWRRGGAELLKEELQRLSWIGVYVIDVGETAPRDVGITDLSLSRETIPEGGSLTVEATVSVIGLEESEKTIEFLLRGRDGRLLKQGQQSIPVGGHGQQGARVPLTLGNLSGPVQHGEVRLVASDPLPMNDVRYFTVAVKPPPKVLLVAPNAAVGDYLKEALVPTGIEKSGKARYVIDDIRPSQLAGTRFSEYAVVVLNSVPVVSEPTWKSLQKFVSNGGGLAVILGSSALINEPNGVDSVSYNSEAAKSLLPAELVATLSFLPPQSFDPKNLNHPALQKLDEFGAAGELAAVEVRKRWTVHLADGATVLMPFSNEKADPALVERRVGSGRVVMLTTAADLRGWNDLPRSWSFIALADQLMQYLSGRNEATFNYLAGQDVVVRADSEPSLTKVLVRKPSGQQLPGAVAAGSNTIRISETDQLGAYDVVSADPQSSFASGFSVNVSAAESDFRRLHSDDLAQMFGEKRVSLARDMETLQRRITTGRLGEEVYPLLLLLALIVFCGEHVVANWFYAEEPTPIAA
jgi:hypothetical protein